MDGNSKISDIQALAVSFGLVVPPLDVAVPEKSILDPVSFPFTVASGPIAVGAVVDITTSEAIPANAGTDGAYSSRGKTSAYVGWVYGLSLVVYRATSADLETLVQSYEAVIKSGGRFRVVPFAELLRIVPGRMGATTATSTTIDNATGCPTAKGQPQYLFGGAAIAWLGSNDELVGIRPNFAGGTLTANVKCQMNVWGILMPGTSKDVRDGSIPTATPCEAPATVSQALRARQTLANFAKSLRG